MGNKSKRNGKTSRVNWKSARSARNMVAASLPPSRTRGWGGLAPPADFGRVVHKGTYQRSYRHEVAVNPRQQPWQRHAAKLAARAKTHLGWNDRRLAREARAREARGS